MPRLPCPETTRTGALHGNLASPNRPLLSRIVTAFKVVLTNRTSIVVILGRNHPLAFKGVGVSGVHRFSFGTLATFPCRAGHKQAELGVDGSFCLSSGLTMGNWKIDF